MSISHPLLSINPLDVSRLAIAEVVKRGGLPKKKTASHDCLLCQTPIRQGQDCLRMDLTTGEFGDIHWSCYEKAIKEKGNNGI